MEVLNLKLGKILGVGILATGILFSGCTEDVENVNNESETAAAVQVANEKFPQFAALNLANETVTDNIFAQKKITVLNIWGTFCPPCIEEMPELGEWARNMPADAQIIGLICDVRGSDDIQTIDAAKKILSEANANFVNLIPDVALEKYLQKVDAVPTTLFIDSQGNLIGEPVVGADVESYKARVADYLK